MLKKLLPLQKGQQSEAMACYYLEQQGCRLVSKNFRCRTGEIDLIMREQETLVFVEVRYRHQKNFGSGIESVNYAKRKKLLRTAEYYLLQQNLTDKVPCRFDIVDISQTSQIEWLKNAFSYDNFR